MLVAAALAVAYLIAHPPSADLAAQVYRTELFRREGFTLWDGQWFGGHHTLGYSVLFPPLGALLGPRVVGALAAVAAAALFEQLAFARFGTRARLGAIWFGAATATNLFSGRLSFALGAAVGLGALLALQRRRPLVAVALAFACPLSSPVAGLFLALAALAAASAARRRLALAVAGAAFAVVVALAIAFPEGGSEPFVTSAFLPVLAFAAAMLAFAPREERALRVGALLYAGATVLAFTLDTPMGGNAARLGTLFGGPLLALALWRRRPAVLAVIALPLLYWQWMAPVRDVVVAREDQSVNSSYYAPLEAYLSGHGAAAGRVEVVPTRNHWETVHVARRFALARGWERQLDVKYNGLFYQRTLGLMRYRAWLRSNAVSYVALPDARLDYAATRERDLIERGASYLQPVWRNRHWRLYRVLGASSLVTGPARLDHLGPDSFALHAQRSGAVTVRVRFTPYWDIARGAGCVERAAGGLTGLVLSHPGPVEVVVRFAPERLIERGPRCSTGP